MNTKALTWSRALGFIAGGGLTVVFAAGGPKWAATGPAVMAVAGLLNVLFPAPTTKIAQDATIVDSGGTPTGATNVSTDSTIPISAPQKG